MLSLDDRKVWQSGVRHLKKNDAALARVIERVGRYDFEREKDYYESLIEAIIFQQLAGKAAQAILNRFKSLYNRKIPTPEEYLKTNATKLRSAGLSPQKMSYIRDLCERVKTGRLQLDKLRGLEDSEVVRQLDEVRGIGRWTAEMFLIFVLGRTNVLPVDDLGIRKAIQKTYRLRRLPDKERIETLTERWRPYRSVATLYLWKDLAVPRAEKA